MTTKVWYDIANDDFRFAQWNDTQDGRAVWLGGDKFQMVRRNELMPPEATHVMRDAQGMMDQLWLLGIRPQRDVGGSGHVKALEDHVKFAETMANGLLVRLKQE